MTPKINLNLYQGNGIPINKRKTPITLPDYTPLSGIENPANYIADVGLKRAVNIALAIGQPLLITGEPGTGKTQLAASIAFELNLETPLVFHAKTTSQASDLFYQYDALGRFHDAHLEKSCAHGPESYISYQALGLAILLANPPSKANPFLPAPLKGKGPRRSVVLIDEIDKSPRDLPNDLLNEVEKMSFTVKETGQTFTAEQTFRPILIITSNSEKHLPDAFLRRCLFYHIPFPQEAQLLKIVERRFNGAISYASSELADLAGHFTEIRGMDLKKKPATAEFIAWLRVLQSLNVKNVRNPSEKDAEILKLSYSILAKSKSDLITLEGELERALRTRKHQNGQHHAG